MSRKLVTRNNGTIEADDEIIDEVVKEFENQEEDDDDDEDMNKLLGEDEDEDDEFYDGLNEDGGDDDDDGMDAGMEELDPQILKIQERVKFLKHRCVSSLGNNLFDKAFGYLKANNHKNADEIREQLIKLLGEESIGFWAILDQILFFESILDDISTNASDN